MGMIVNGVWHDKDQTISNGSFNRPQTRFRFQELDVGKGGFINAGQYILFLSLSCPWCHRLSIIHKIKKLEDLLPIHIVGGPRVEGYSLGGGAEIRVAGLAKPQVHLHELYSASDADFTGRSTIPVLWDSKSASIINNESADILRILNQIKSPQASSAPDFYPHDLQPSIDQWNEKIYSGLNNAVYEAGFATRQHVYEEAVQRVFHTLNQLEQHLQDRPYMMGENITETDCRLYPTLVRFDPIYHSHFKCSLKRIADYPNLSRYMKNLADTYDLHDTTDMEVIRQAYFFNDRNINPHGIVPLATII